MHQNARRRRTSALFCAKASEMRVESVTERALQELGVMLRRFQKPDEVREMEKGKYEIVGIGGQTLGLATYEPGWQWSKHVGPSVGASRCGVEHLGYVLAGAATVAFDDGVVVELRRSTLFYIPPVPHDSWVVGDESYVALHFLGADQYAR